MCNNYEQRISYEAYRAAVKAIELEVPDWQSERDLPQAHDVRIKDLAPVVRAAGEGVELAQMQFGLPPQSQNGGLVFNFRSEGRHFANSKRCLIPASAFFEFTGTKYPKAKHRFTLNEAPFMAIAGIWRGGDGNQPPTFAMLTTEPSADIEPYHNRQVVVLRPRDWLAWLRLTRPEVELLTALPVGSLAAETVRLGSD